MTRIEERMPPISDVRIRYSQFGYYSGNSVSYSGHLYRAQGFTLIELLISLAIAGILVAVGVAAFSTMNRGEALQLEADKIVSLLGAARADTLAAKGGAQYGVHFEERKAVRFQGTTYSASDPNNRVQELHREVKISATALLGGGSEVLFQKLTGRTAQSGTVTLTLVSDASKTKIVTIARTGVAYSN